MSDVFATQVPVQVEIGGKPIPELFIGAYAGLGFGGVSSSFEKGCGGVGVDCSSRSTRIGIEAMGPLVDVAVGQYGSIQSDATQAGPAVDRDIANGALHAWVSVGARVVFFP